MKRFLIDPSRCIQCYNCKTACKDEHCDNDWSPIAKPKGADQFWIRIEEREVSTGARVKIQRLQVPCQHCEKPSCMAAAPDAVYKRDDGLVIIEPEKAVGVKELVDACPYGAIYWNDGIGIAQKCTGCAHLLDNGWEEPRCVEACPTGALRFVEEEGLADENLYAPLEKLHPEYDTKPSSYYVNLPRPFVGGSVVDAAGESVVGVRVTATHQISGLERSGFTDAFGDFDIKNLEPGFYTILLERSGFCPKQIANVDIRKALNMDEIRMVRLG